MESPDISAIGEDSEVFSTVPSSESTESEKSPDELLGNSESLLAGIPPLADKETSQDVAETEESQSLLVNVGSNSKNVGDGIRTDIGDESEMVVDKSNDEDILGERNNEVGMDEENSEDIGGGGGESEAIPETEVDDNTEDNQQEEMETGDLEDDENDETENSSAAINLPFGRVKKIMKICVNTNPDEEVSVEESRVEISKSKRKSGKGSKKSIGGSSGSTANFIIAKEAIYLTAAATELFVSAVAQQSARLAVSSKKKNVTLEHLKRSLSSVESYEFLQGCFNPSILIGD